MIILCMEFILLWSFWILGNLLDVRVKRDYKLNFPLWGYLFWGMSNYFEFGAVFFGESYCVILPFLLPTEIAISFVLWEGHL